MTRKQLPPEVVLGTMPDRFLVGEQNLVTAGFQLVNKGKDSETDGETIEYINCGLRLFLDNHLHPVRIILNLPASENIVGYLERIEDAGWTIVQEITKYDDATFGPYQQFLYEMPPFPLIQWGYWQLLPKRKKPKART